MYPPMHADSADYYVKPMNCPFHVLVYKSRTRSYRELPIRLSELGTIYRHERLGTLHGLLRIRGGTQDDSHIICTPDQLIDEILRVFDLTSEIHKTFGPTKVSTDGRSVLRVEGAAENILRFMSWFDVPEDSYSGWHRHFDRLDGSPHVAEDCLDVVVGVR